MVLGEIPTTSPFERLLQHVHLRESVHQIDAHSLTLTNMSNVQDADQLLQRKRRWLQAPTARWIMTGPTRRHRHQLLRPRPNQSINAFDSRFLCELGGSQPYDARELLLCPAPSMPEVKTRSPLIPEHGGQATSARGCRPGRFRCRGSPLVT